MPGWTASAHTKVTLRTSLGLMTPDVSGCQVDEGLRAVPGWGRPRAEQTAWWQYGEWSLMLP